ncbi:ATP-binding protein [Solimonas marina]|uniref:histidine kinase n=1 Tax=Solimonas marina TaxID=2714601 RepID=A0A970B5J6_9GAMM|nr:response regulator [Solimonas marina]
MNRIVRKLQRTLRRIPASYRWSVLGLTLVAVLTFNAWLAILSAHRLFDQQAQSRFGLRVEARINTVQSLAKDIDNSTRGYLLSGSVEYLQPYREAATRLNTEMSLLANELQRFPDNANSARALYRSIYALIDQTQTAITARSAMGNNPSVRQIEPQLALETQRIEQLRNNAVALRELQSKINLGLEQTLQQSRRDTLIAIVVPSVISILMAGLLWTLAVRDLRQKEILNRERRRLLEQERRARAEAEAASQARDDFVAAVSHELRTPLQAILGWSQFMRRVSASGDDTPAASLDSALISVERNARQLSSMVDGLLDASLALSGRIELQADAVDLGEILRAAIDLMQPAARAKRVGLDLLIGPQPLPLIGDAQRLRQIVINLVGNAVKFTPSGGQVTVRAGRADAQLEFSVGDTGIGIRRDLLPLVFQRYVQGSEPTTRQHGGLGLGLAIVKHLVEMHGGQIEASSAGLGHGAQFVVRLPTQSPAADTAPPPVAPTELSQPLNTEPSPAAQLERLHGLRMLVVDDDADVRAVLEMLLAVEGAQVRAAASAAEALDALRGSRIDIVLSDVGMPDVDGYALARAVRALSLGESASPADTPMIALTAFSRAEDERRAIDSGFDAHIGKPVDVERLIAVIRACAAAPDQPLERS